VSDEPRRYLFPPLERRGVVFGLGAPQLLVLAGAGVVLVSVVRSVAGLGGFVLAALVMAMAAAGVLWPVSGRPLSGWVVIVATWSWRRFAPVVSDAPCRGATQGRPAPTAPTRALAGLRILEPAVAPGLDRIGVVHDTRFGAYAAIIRVRGRSFSLLDPLDKQRRLEAWGAILAGVSRQGSPVHRLQWIERCMPADRDGLARYLAGAGTAGPGPCRASYEELVAGAGPVGQDHEVLLVVAVRARRAPRPRPVVPRRDDPGCAALSREVRLLLGQLRNADLTVDRVLDGAAVHAALQRGFGPGASSGGEGGGGPGAGPVAGGGGGAGEVPGRSPWPLAADDGWSMCRVEGAWSVTYWVEEWPRVEVGPDALVPLLLGAGVWRAVSVVMAPVPPAQAVREVEAARTADLADDELRRRAGFVVTARRRRQAEGVLQREAELAGGHGEYRFSGYVTVSALERSELERACAELEQTARHAHLELRRLYGRQEEALTWTLPLARGLS